MRIRLNVDLGGFKAGRVLGGTRIETAYWRRRIRDSRIDGCVTILSDSQAKAEVSHVKQSETEPENAPKKPRKYRKRKNKKED